MRKICVALMYGGNTAGLLDISCDGIVLIRTILYCVRCVYISTKPFRHMLYRTEYVEIASQTYITQRVLLESLFHNVITSNLSKKLTHLLFVVLIDWH